MTTSELSGFDHPLTAFGSRPIHRARERFGDFLLAEIADTMNNPSTEDLEDELVQLELLQYCQPAIERRRSKESVSADPSGK